MSVAVGIDLGGTKVAATTVDSSGATGAVRTVPTPADRGPAAILDAVAGLVRRITDDAGEPAVAVGVGAAGVIDPATGRVRSATGHLAGWAGTDVRDQLTSRLGLPVAVENDVHAHAAGEAWRGAAAGVGYALVVAVGTGVGGAVVAGGDVVRGARAAAGHIGHVPSPEAAGLSCECGGTGHVEAVASGQGLCALYRRLGGGVAVEGARDVLECAAGTDNAAREAVRESASALGRVIGGIANVVDPDVIVLTGGLANAGAQWWEPVRAAVAAEVIPALSGLRVVRGELGDRAGLVGAGRTGLRAAGCVA